MLSIADLNCGLRGLLVSGCRSAVLLIELTYLCCLLRLIVTGMPLCNCSCCLLSYANE